MSFDHERPDNLNPSEWEYGYIAPNGATILVSKVGGGTLGRAYDGHWHYSYSRRDERQEGSDLYTPMQTTHADAAAMVFDFLAGES